MQPRDELSALDQCGSVREDVSVVFPAASDQQWQHGEHARIVGAPEVQGRQVVGAPAQRAEDVAGVARDRGERGVQRGATDVVDDDVEARAAG
ncbi:Uncharacterised protein [Mycolicibacterium tokaiense]|uniref:Uncharacterized protein n=1 Tax=Mycolicibacterium tokaiense TaxID=39695 RepID=A0A378TNC7_9MYCO|nr:hypothetical protein MTOK_51770 [Mycolicibacterium tokaiense]STZ62219.1 Uncharacterised protein [Mycolicibacterium tokaiense]